MPDDYGLRSNITDDDDFLVPITEEEEKKIKIKLLKEKIQYYQDIINKLMMEYYELDNVWYSDDGLD